MSRNEKKTLKRKNGLRLSKASSLMQYLTNMGSRG